MILKSQPHIIVEKVNIIVTADNFYYDVNLAMLALLSEAFGKFRNTRSRVTDDVRVPTADHDRKVKSLYRQEVAHGRYPRMYEKLSIKFLRGGNSEFSIFYNSQTYSTKFARYYWFVII